MYKSAAAFVLLIASSVVCAQSATQPALHDLQRETRKLYRDVQQSVVHVHVPVQVIMRVIGQENPLQKWGPMLDPNVREQLERQFAREQQQRAGGPMSVNSERPAPSTSQPVQVNAPSPASGSGGVVLTPSIVTADYVGLVLSPGFVVLPTFVDKAVVGEIPVRVTHDDRHETIATLVGGDAMTNLALFRLAQPIGTPVKLTDDAPEVGSLVLVIAPVRRTVRLSLWAGGQDENGIVVSSAGAVAGFARNGRLLEPAAFLPIVKQLVNTGAVRRARLGVVVQELAPDDPARIQNKLADRPVAQVVEVQPNSAAQAAGVLKGDLVLSLGDQPVHDLAHFAAAMVDRAGPTDLKILRQGAEQTLRVNLK